MNTKTQQIRVLIVDDEALMRAGIRLLIDGAGAGEGRRIAVIGEAADGAAALVAAREHDPDVILMDIRMPGMGGIEATQALQAAGSRARVIMLTAFDTDEFVVESLRGGAVSFLLKDSAPAVVISAVTDAVSGSAHLAPTVVTRLVELAAKSAAGAGPDQPGGVPAAPLPTPDCVTDREWEVGRLAAQGYTNKEIADSLFLSVSTVKTHLASVFTKLDVTNRTQVGAYLHERSSRAG